MSESLSEEERQRALEEARAMAERGVANQSERALLATDALLTAKTEEARGLRESLREAWLNELYVDDGPAIWIADAEKKGHTLEEQLTRLEQLRTGAFA